MNVVGYITLTVDWIAFTHNLVVFSYLAFQLKRYHRREYKLKRNGLVMYFSIIYVNFIVYSIVQTFMVFCTDFTQAPGCKYRVESCSAAGLLRGEALYVLFYICAFTQLPQILIAYIVIFKKDQSDCI